MNKIEMYMLFNLISIFNIKVKSHGAELYDVSHTLIALIPKIKHPQHVTDFRPISLCTVVYKLISKSMVNRMKRILPEVISPYQSAFVPGRHIQDNIITAFETIHSIRACHSAADPRLVLKLDISKAYDRVEWSFLSQILTRIGFANLWVDLIMRCVTSVSFSVLWQGRPIGFFKPTRGIRQGDPLSPYLFLLVSEGLSGLFQKAVSNGFIHGVEMGGAAPPISHLLFADDSLIFGRAIEEEVVFLKQCLLLYENAAGQRINFQKSALSFGPGVKNAVKDMVQNILGVPTVPFHEKYLGLPTVSGRSKKQMFKRIDERLEAHMSGWQSKFLSKAGKVILVKAVAQAIPTYSMSVFRLPKGVCKAFRSKIARFWWGKGDGRRGIHWCKWEFLCKHKNEGGLGFRDLEAFNQALLAKTVWRIALAPTSLVHRVLQGKYFPNSSWADAPLGIHHSLIWRSLLWGRELVHKGIRWRIQNGNSVKVWGDKWLPRPWTFQVSSPYSLSINTKVSDLMTSSGIWNYDLIRAAFLPHDAEAILSIPITNGRGSDTTIWHYRKDGNYSVRSGYRLAIDSNRVRATAGEGCSHMVETSRSNLWSQLWRLKVANKIKIFLWRACHNFLPCAANLLRRKIGNGAQCVRCGCPEETTIHALWNCKAARQAWKHTFLFDVYKEWREPDFKDLFSHVAKTFSQAQLELFAVVAWGIWKQRNDIKFGKVESRGEHIVIRAQEWLGEFNEAHRPITMNKSSHTVSNQLSGWSPPATNFLKVNVDAACDSQQQRTGLGVVIRNDCGG